MYLLQPPWRMHHLHIPSYYFYHPAWQKAHIIKVLNMQFSQVRCYCLPLGSKNSTWHSVFKHPHTLFINPTVRLPISHSYKTAGKYIHIISVHSVGRNIHVHLVKTSVNFLQTQLHTKNSLVAWNCKVCDFLF